MDFNITITINNPKEVEKMTQAVQKLQAAMAEQFAAMNSHLDNINADVAGLAKQVSDLKEQIANSGSVLTAEDQAAIDGIVQTAQTLEVRLKQTADLTPDIPAVLPTGTTPITT